MTTEPNPQPTPAPAPAAPPADYIPAHLLSDRIMERIEHELDQPTRDRIEKARIAGREAQRDAAAKEKAAREAESAASTKRAADVVDEIVKRDEIQTEDGQTPGYDLEIPEVSAENQKVLTETVHDVGILGLEAQIPPEQLQILVNTATDFALQEPPGLDYSNREECENVLKTKWGEDYDRRVSIIQQTVAKWGPSVQAYLDGTGLGNSPGVLEAIYQYASGNTRHSRESAAAEIAKINADLKHPYWKGDRNAVATMRTLREIAHRGESNEMPITKTVSQSTSAVQEEIAAIRANPAYSGLDAKARKPLTERMAVLMRSLHGQG